MTREEFNKMEKLYHYTSLCSALRIIASNTLLFNPLKKMNDINELYRPSYFNCSCNDKSVQYAEMEVARFQQISLTRDALKKGFDIPAMWSHYADKGKGVCLVFDKEKLLRGLPDFVIEKDDVCYSDDLFVGYDFKANSDRQQLSPFNKIEIKDFFYHKTNDWAYEQEFRILAKSNNDDLNERMKLPINDSMKAIILCSPGKEKVFLKSEFKIIKKIFPCDLIFDYGRFLNEVNLSDIKGNCVWSSIDSNLQLCVE